MVLPKGVQKLFAMDIVGHDFNLGRQLCELSPKCTFNKFAQMFYRRYRKVQTNEQVYMTLKIIKQNLNEKVEEYYE
jgi:hypothetical protein